jgi:hypothetical protein
VSIPGHALAQAQCRARRTRNSRPGVFSRAVRESVARHRPEDATDDLDARVTDRIAIIESPQNMATLLCACVRMLGSLLGGLIMFAVWLIAVLSRMPRPPVPPSLAVTLIAPVVAAIGFGLGMLGAERLTQRRHGGARGAFLWPLAGGVVGTLAMFPFGGMMAGIGLFGFGTSALLIREVLWLRNPGAARQGTGPDTRRHGRS